MVKKELVNELIDDGATLLRELDHREFPVEAMFWVNLPDQDYWRLVIASPHVRVDGPAAAYRKLGEILRGIDLSELALEDISLLEPDSEQYRALRSVVESSSRLAPGASWLRFEDAIVYRWNSASVSAELDCDVEPEQLARIWEGHRKPVSLSVPSLVFTSVGRRVTIRFHPQHGPQRQIAGIKKEFERALHSAEPFRRCRIRWVD